MSFLAHVESLVKRNRSQIHPYFISCIILEDDNIIYNNIIIVLQTSCVYFIMHTVFIYNTFNFIGGKATLNVLICNSDESSVWLVSEIVITTDTYVFVQHIRVNLDDTNIENKSVDVQRLA